MNFGNLCSVFLGKLIKMNHAIQTVDELRTKLSPELFFNVLLGSFLGFRAVATANHTPPNVIFDAYVTGKADNRVREV